ncbi:hypothetical protein GETHLI_20490 [Geothrix limicola]|uniref:Outer membrane protein beta-barrel domain-containing protein n=1 Tax=Geothrix limicola TaxID=2927978 RepID=A0ABQ5QG19_9BACT|nr:hypothetical protein [Geothrix limicola]GLH73547.1 hypothetical protein GETHLI_20490 [Geothrix limicola]
MTLKRFLMLPLAALPLLGQANADTIPLEGSFNLVIASQDMNKLVRSGNLAGYTAGLALRSEVKPGLDLRYHLNFMFLRGADGTGLKNANRPHFFGGMDVMQELNAKWSVFGGPMAVQWKQNKNQATDPSFNNSKPASSAFPNGGNNYADGTKFGFRIGAEYRFSKKLRTDLSFQQAEFNKVFNPSWYSVGLTYLFN